MLCRESSQLIFCFPSISERRRFWNVQDAEECKYCGAPHRMVAAFIPAGVRQTGCFVSIDVQYRTHEEIRKSEMMNPFLRALDRSCVQPPTRKQFPRLEYVDLRLENLTSSTNMCNQAFSLQTCAHHTCYTVLYYIEYLYVVVQSWFIQYYQRISYAILMYIITIQYKPCISLSLHMYIMYQYAWCIKHYLYDCFCFMYHLHRSCAFLLSYHDLNTNIASCTLQTRANVTFQSDPLVSLLIYDNLWSIKCGQDSILVRSISCCVTKKHCTQACMFIQCDVSFCRVHATHIGHMMPMARLEFIVLVCCFCLNDIL